ncbi:hypothetical protein [Streptomyces sp. NPDC059452]|uniref:hypothetical protein n=1 Tax=Streptomyces sp. NPDC059452 TaxID=3346835 RepID=UPI0036A35D16
MTTEPTAFPPRPLRGVHATYARQAGCPSDFARVIVDFEPSEQGLTVHEVDSSPRSFRAAGRLAVPNALAQA